MYASNATTRRRAKLQISVAHEIDNLTALTQADKVPARNDTAAQVEQWLNQGNTIVDSIRRGMADLKALPIVSVGERNDMTGLTEDADAAVKKFNQALSVTPLIGRK